MMRFCFLLMFGSLLFAETLKEHEARIERMEAELKKEVALYNERLKTGKEPERPVGKEGLPASISSDPQIQQEQMQQVLDAVQRLTKEVEDLKKGKSVVSSDDTDKAQKKKVKAEKPPLDLSLDGQKLREAEALIEKEPQKALDALTKIAEVCTGTSASLDAFLLIVSAYMKLGKWDLAVKTADSILSDEKCSVYMQAQAMLLKAKAQHQKNDRKAACKTLYTLERSNIELTAEQNVLYQDLVVASDCSSKLDKDKKEEGENE
ncbi:MAG: hypothetical protein FADNKDHG_01335 [Holosporales bacterium]